MKLSDKQKRIISSVQFQAKAPIAQIAEETGYKPHIVRHTLNFLREKGILTPCIYIDPKRLGLSTHLAYFSYLCESEAERQKLRALLQQSRKVVVAREYTGEYQFQATIFAESSEKVNAFFAEISANCRGFFLNKAVSERKRWSLYRHKFFSDHPSAIDSVDFCREIKEEGPLTLDELDHRILQAISRNPLLTTAQLARNLGTAKSTVDDRIKYLEEAKIICGYGYSLNEAMSVVYCWRLIVWMKQANEKICADFFRFSRSHPNIRGIAHCVGSWDFELAIRAEDAKEISAITQSIYSRYREEISSLKLLAIVERLKWNMYPS